MMKGEKHRKRRDTTPKGVGETLPKLLSSETMGSFDVPPQPSVGLLEAKKFLWPTEVDPRSHFNRTIPIHVSSQFQC
jgi:hypothetical protein